MPGPQERKKRWGTKDPFLRSSKNEVPCWLGSAKERKKKKRCLKDSFEGETQRRGSPPIAQHEKRKSSREGRGEQEMLKDEGKRVGGPGDNPLPSQALRGRQKVERQSLRKISRKGNF